MTQVDRILRHLNEFGSITAMDAVKEYGIMRLASRIADLRKMNVSINSVYESGINRFGEIVHYVRYILADSEDKCS